MLKNGQVLFSEPLFSNSSRLAAISVERVGCIQLYHSLFAYSSVIWSPNMATLGGKLGSTEMGNEKTKHGGKYKKI